MLYSTSVKPIITKKYPFLLSFKEKDLVKVNFSFWVSGSYGRCLRNVHFRSFVFIINLIFYKTILISSFKNTINLGVWLTHLTMAVHIVYNNTAVVDKACQLFPCQQDKRGVLLSSFRPHAHFLLWTAFSKHCIIKCKSLKLKT